MSVPSRSTGIAALSLGLTFTLFAAALHPAQAATTSPPESLSKIVSTSDLNLTTSEGRRLLDTRIRGAARAVCTVVSKGRATIEEQRCRDDAIAGTRVRVAQLVDESRALAAEGFQPRLAARVVVRPQ